MALVSGFNQLPGSYLLFGKVALWQLIGVYGLIIFVWQFPKGKQLWQGVTLVAIALMLLPIIDQKLSLKQMTVFATDQPAVILIQNRGNITLINCGEEATIRYTLVPFLQQEGIQTINTAIALQRGNQWDILSQVVDLKQLFYSPLLENEIQEKSNANFTSKQATSAQTSLVNQQNLNIKQSTPMLLTINWDQKQWGILQYPRHSLPTVTSDFNPIDILLWQGQAISHSWLEAGELASAIAVTNQVSEELKANLAQKDIDFYITGQHGAIQWTPNRGLKTMLD
jgi:competence protein ComEC